MASLFQNAKNLMAAATFKARVVRTPAQPGLVRHDNFSDHRTFVAVELPPCAVSQRTLKTFFSLPSHRHLQWLAETHYRELFGGAILAQFHDASHQGRVDADRLRCFYRGIHGAAKPTQRMLFCNCTIIEMSRNRFQATTQIKPVAFRGVYWFGTVWIWLHCNHSIPYPLSRMANDTAPATKADLQAMEERILKAIAAMNDVMQQQFHFVAGEIDKLQKSVADLHIEIGTIQENVQEMLDESKTKHRKFEARIRRCERRLGIAA